mmetsp:Transcript_25859/g.45930  ORF Transcript_25859/g.45930 Transcript_25859/m.45930 type:complete len:314 (-) Transcript_25859:232-1173(-)
MMSRDTTFFALFFAPPVRIRICGAFLLSFPLLFFSFFFRKISKTYLYSRFGRRGSRTRRLSTIGIRPWSSSPPTPSAATPSPAPSTPSPPSPSSSASSLLAIRLRSLRISIASVRFSTIVVTPTSSSPPPTPSSATAPAATTSTLLLLSSLAVINAVFGAIFILPSSSPSAALASSPPSAAAFPFVLELFFLSFYHLLGRLVAGVLGVRWRVFGEGDLDRRNPTRPRNYFQPFYKWLVDVRNFCGADAGDLVQARDQPFDDLRDYDRRVDGLPHGPKGYRPEDLSLRLIGILRSLLSLFAGIIFVGLCFVAVA